jgi:prepilin-type N-terminal cleavage/methylation domain-containing protein
MPNIKSILTNYAFSLVEIMVALAIIASMIGIGTYMYTGHINKTRIASALITLSALEQIAKLQYEEHSIDTSISFGGTAYANNTVTSLDQPPVVNGMYIYPGGSIHVASNEFLVCVYVGKLNFLGYVAPTPGTAGSYSRLCKQISAGDSIYTNKCGSLQGSSSDIPVDYLPTGCDCANIWGGTC